MFCTQKRLWIQDIENKKKIVSELDNKMNPTEIHKRVKVLQFDKHLENVTGKGNKDLYQVSGFSFVHLILVWIC